ncbi:MAG: hypothetical protein Q9224_006879, partial [Gallowayella concinna]
MPGLKESMLAIQSTHKQGPPMDHNTIQALGRSIANQLAELVSSGRNSESNTKSVHARDRAWQYPELPRDRLPKRRLRSPSPLPQPAPSPTRHSLWAPVYHPKPRKRPRLVGPQTTTTGDSEDIDMFTIDDDEGRHDPAMHQEGSMKKCYNCECTSSRTWRTGPDGDLCNTCGMYFYRYGLLRPTGAAAESDDEGTPDRDDEGDPLDIDPLRLLHSPRGANELKVTGVKNTHFLLEEDVLLLKLKEVDLISWETCALQFSGRSAYALQCRYSKKLHGRPCEARDILMREGYRIKENSNGTVSFDYRRDKFTEDEDDLLLKLRDDGLDWRVIEPSFQGRSGEHLERRYHELAGEFLEEISESHKCSTKEADLTSRLCLRYSAEEDELIIRLREVQKLGWAEIAQQMPGRNAMSLQKRYVRELAGKHWISDPPIPSGRVGRLDNHPDGEVSLKNMMYSAAEDELLLWYRNDEQLEWDEITEKMP